MHQSNVFQQGTAIVPGSPGSGAEVIKHTDASTLKIIEIKSSERGVWTLSVSTTGTYNIEVVADSLLLFSYQFVEFVDTGHSGYTVIDGKPLAGMTSNTRIMPNWCLTHTNISHDNNRFLVGGGGGVHSGYIPLVFSKKSIDWAICVSFIYMCFIIYSFILLILIHAWVKYTPLV